MFGLSSDSSTEVITTEVLHAFIISTVNAARPVNLIPLIL
jgi:hypothetical protein